MNTDLAFGPPTQHTFNVAPSLVPSPQRTARVIELPWPLVRRQQPTLALLFARGDLVTSTGAFWASPDAITYSQQTTGALHFGASATLAQEYPAGAPLIDESAGILVNWSGNDRVESVTDIDAGALTLLAFVDDEIISVRDINILSATQAQLLGHRRCVCGTPRQTHAANSAIVFLRRDQLRPFSDPFRYRYLTTWWWKLQPVWFNRYRPLVECDPLMASTTIVGTTCQPAPHLNLRVNGAAVNATASWGSDVAVEWDLADWRAESFWALFRTPFMPRDIGSKITVVSADNAVLRVVLLGPGVSAWTYSAAAVAADFGAPPASFRLRVSAIWDGFESATVQEVNVTF